MEVVIISAIMIIFLILRILQRIVASRKKKFDHDISEITTRRFNEHKETLFRKRASMIITDDYGIEDNAKWEKELRYFVNRVIMPDIECLPDYDNQLSDINIKRKDLSYQITHTIDEKMASINAKPYLAGSENYDDSMSPVEYEHFCANLLRSNGWKAQVTPASGDQGVDIIAEKNQQKIAVQCKKYTSPVGNKAVQEVRTAVDFIDADYGTVVAPIGYTRSAKELANKTGIYLLHHSELKNISQNPERPPLIP